MDLKPRIGLHFKGQCQEALQLYKRCLGAEVAFSMTWGESPMANDVPPEWRAKIFHATIKVGDAVLNAGDVPQDKYESPKGFSLILNMNDAAAAERAFHALAENGTIRVPLQKTFWAVTFGDLVDAFGIPWTINCEA